MCLCRPFSPSPTSAQTKLLDRTVRLEGAPPRRSYRLLPAPLPASARAALRRAGATAGSTRRPSRPRPNPVDGSPEAFVRPAAPRRPSAAKAAAAAAKVPGFDPRDPMIGRTVWRFWPEDGGWFQGIVRAHDARARQWKVVYDEV